MTSPLNSQADFFGPSYIAIDIFLGGERTQNKSITSSGVVQGKDSSGHLKL